MSKAKKLLEEGRKAKAVADAEKPEVSATEATEEGGSITLTISDLQAQSRLFELAATRGTFHANEMSVVGAVVDKLNNFLTQVADAQKAAEDAAGDGAKSIEGADETGGA